MFSSEWRFVSKAAGVTFWELCDETGVSEEESCIRIAYSETEINSGRGSSILMTSVILSGKTHSHPVKKIFSNKMLTAAY